MAVLSKLVGAVDNLGRPVVRVAIVGRDDEILGTIDTGFNGEVMLAAGDAGALGVFVSEDAEDVEPGHGEMVDVRVGRLRLKWLDVERDVVVLVSDRETLTREGNPILLIGTRLLKPHLLLIDFAQGTVEIETQE